MDIKDIILIGGGLLIAAVVAHGFWIAWRARRDPLRLDLVTDLPESDGGEDELKHLRAELPNGGARLVGDAPSQGALNLDRGAEPADAGASAVDPLERPAGGRATRARSKTEPRLDPAPPAADEAPAPEEETEKPAPAAGHATPRDKVRDVILPERPPRAGEPRRGDGRGSGHDKPGGEERRGGEEKRRAEERRRSAGGSRSAGVQGPSETRSSEKPVEELIMLNVLAPKGRPFVGGGLVEALRARGLRYGDMNIFHRVDPMSRATLYSVANVVEPGTFDLADLENFRSPGVCFFMQLPGPEAPMDVFEDMLKVARDVAVRVDGTLLDEQRSVMTGQTVEHYRQRISDFCRRRMSMRA